MKKYLLLTLVLVLSLFAGVASVGAQGGTVRVRVAHFSVDAPAVDVYVNGRTVLRNVAYPAMSDYLALDAGTYRIAVAPAGAGIGSAVIGPVDLTFAADHDYTVAAIGQLADGSFGPTVIDETAAFAGQDAYLADVIVLHGISDAPAVDLALTNGTVLAGGLPFGQHTTLSVPAGSYPLVVTAAGSPSTVVFNELNGAPLTAGFRYFVAAIGTFPGNFQLFATMLPTASLAEIIANAPGFETLAAAVEAAGLGETLASGGPFTLFAPANEAFAALPAGTLDAVLADQNLLTSILLYHVVDGAAYASQVVGLDSVRTLQGGTVSITVTTDGRVLLNDSIEVIVTDIVGTNGVIHVISGVLLPQ